MMPVLLDLSLYKSILCLNGLLPDQDFFASHALPVIAADGAANTLLQMGIKPELIIGDLDSISLDIRAEHAVLHIPDQNKNDFQKSLEYLRSQDFLPAIIVGINGGYLDHILNNVNIFMETNSLLYAPPILGFVIQAGQAQTLSLPIHTKISLLGIPAAKMSSQGLKWELDESNLSFPGTTSCFNRVREESVLLEVHEGGVLVLIYQDLDVA